MTDVLTGTPAAAWYPDPAQPQLLRWWDGSSWSVHTMANPDAAVAIEDPRPTPAPAHAPAPAIPEPMPFASGVSLGVSGADRYNTEASVLTPIERAARAEIYAQLASSHAKEALPAANPADSNQFRSISNPSPMTWNAPTPSQLAYADGPIPSATLGVWLLVLWPTIGAFAVGFLSTSILTMSDPLIPAIAVLAGFLLVPFLFAAMDRSKLRQHGHLKVPSGWWLLTGWLGYLIARTVILSRRSGKAFVPLLAFLLIGVASATFNVLTSPLLNAPSVEEQLTAQLTEQTGLSYGVECPEGLQPPYSCHAVAPDGSSFDIDVTLEGGLMKFTPDESSFVGPT